MGVSSVVVSLKLQDISLEQNAGNKRGLQSPTNAIFSSVYQ